MHCAAFNAYVFANRQKHGYFPPVLMLVAFCFIAKHFVSRQQGHRLG